MLKPILPWKENAGLNVEVPLDANELLFFRLFFTKTLVTSITTETNRYAAQFLEKHCGTLGPSSNYRRWPINGINEDKMLAFLALAYFMGMLPKCNVKDYWTVDKVMSTPFPGTVMSRNDFMVILSFLHCADNAQYITKGQPGYNPKNKLGTFYEECVRKYEEVWTPRNI